jgi:S-methylmethionine-dependent homocysteine/selenocysteine methylase
LTTTRIDIRSRLEHGDRLVLDGANSTEFKRRGIISSINPDGTVNEGITTWSARVAIEAPEHLWQVHEDYLRAGADIVTTNTFNTSRSKLILRGLDFLADRAEELTRCAAEITVQARDSIRPDAYVAGSISQPLYNDRFITVNEMADEYRQQAAVLAETGVDVILLEYTRTVQEAVIAIDAVTEFGLPVFLGMANVTTDGTLEGSVPVEALVDALRNHPPDVIMTMCSRPLAVSATLPSLHKEFDGPKGGYSNIVNMTDDFLPDAYSTIVRDWLHSSAQIVGGCCGTTPAHIAAVRGAVDEAR